MKHMEHNNIKLESLDWSLLQLNKYGDSIIANNDYLITVQLMKLKAIMEQLKRLQQLNWLR